MTIIRMLKMTTTTQKSLIATTNNNKYIDRNYYAYLFNYFIVS